MDTPTVHLWAMPRIPLGGDSKRVPRAEGERWRPVGTPHPLGVPVTFCFILFFFLSPSFFLMGARNPIICLIASSGVKLEQHGLLPPTWPREQRRAGRAVDCRDRHRDWRASSRTPPLHPLSPSSSRSDHEVKCVRRGSVLTGTP